jgi:hypothetical protein
MGFVAARSFLPPISQLLLLLLVLLLHAGNWWAAPQQLLPDSGAVPAGEASRGAHDHTQLCCLFGGCETQVGGWVGGARVHGYNLLA